MGSRDLGDRIAQPAGDQTSQRLPGATREGPKDLSSFRPIFPRPDQIRLLLEHRAVERAELERVCSELRIPGDFDVAQISWRPDYDPFFYRQLARRARRIYLFRDEYIFDAERAVVVETPRLGHATYVFAKPRSMESFLALYTRITKDDIRRNRQNVAERLGFLGRVIHGTNSRAWVKEVRQHIGEKTDFAMAIQE